MMRYSLDNETMEAHYFYNSAISGFVNLTSIKRAPLFLSYIHMFNVDHYWINKVEGMVPNWETDMILAYVAPVLGRSKLHNRIFYSKLGNLSLVILFVLEMY